MTKGSLVHKATHTHSDTWLVTPKILEEWKLPNFQRPLRVNSKVEALAEQIKHDGGVIPGVITLAQLKDDTYLLDGQHRVRAFLISGFAEGYADVRIHRFENFGDMGREFVNLNSRLVVMRPDDILRGLEPANSNLQAIRNRCKFVGYDIGRRGDNAPFLSMSLLLRSWFASASEAPASGSHGGGGAAPAIAENLTLFDASTASDVALLFHKAWGPDPQYGRLWKALNMTICMWLYRRVVLNQVQREGRQQKKSQVLSKELFTKAMMSVSSDQVYLDWLFGRNRMERDRSSCLTRLKTIIARRVEQETGKRPLLPQPEWQTT